MVQCFLPLLVAPPAGVAGPALAGRRADRWAVWFGVAVQGSDCWSSLAMLADFDTDQSQVMQFTVSIAGFRSSSCRSVSGSTASRCRWWC